MTKKLALGLIAACLATAGCTQDPDSPLVDPNGDPRVLRVQPRDIPTPWGLGWRAHESYFLPGEGQRRARLVYEGEVAIEEVLAFYRETMPREGFGWRAEGEERSGNRHELRFSKRGEFCTLRISLLERGVTRCEISLGGAP